MSRTYKDRNTLVELYHEQQLGMREVADKLDCSLKTIQRWMGKFNIPTRTPWETRYLKTDYPFRNKELMEELYLERGLSSQQIGEMMGHNSGVIVRWLHNHGIETRDKTPEPNMVPTLRTKPSPNSYEVIYIDGEEVPVHRLTAVAEFGLEEVVGQDVHHKNEIKWDNRPENLEVMSHSDHVTYHSTT